MTNLDPIESSEIMELLGANYVDLDDPKRHQMIDGIVRYFAGREDKRIIILGIISKRSGMEGKNWDSIDIVWNWVQLSEERERLMRELPKDEFTEDIQKEIKNEYLTRDNIKILKNQIEERIKKEEGTEDEKDIEKVLNISQLQDIQKKVGEIEQINEMLNE